MPVVGRLGLLGRRRRKGQPLLMLGAGGGLLPWQAQPRRRSRPRQRRPTLHRTLARLMEDQAAAGSVPTVSGVVGEVLASRQAGREAPCWAGRQPTRPKGGWVASAAAGSGPSAVAWGPDPSTPSRAVAAGKL